MKLPLLILSLSIASIDAIAQVPPALPPNQRTISVEGSAEMEIIPNEIYVTVTLREYEKRNSGKIDIETIKKNFLQNCRSIGLPDSLIKVDSYAGDSDFGWWKRNRKRDGLNSAIIYQIKFSSVDLIDKLVSILDDDATENFNIVRTSHSNIREFRKQLKIDAVKAAKAKASYLAEAIDEKIGSALTIIEPVDDNSSSYNISNFNSLRLAQSNVAYDDKPNGSLIEFKKIRLRYAAQVVFALK